MDNLNRAPVDLVGSVKLNQVAPQLVSRSRSNSLVEAPRLIAASPAAFDGKNKALSFLSPPDSDSDEETLDPGAVLSMASFQLESEAQKASQAPAFTPIPSRSSTPLPVINESLSAPLLDRNDRSDSLLSPMSPQISCPSSPSRRSALSSANESDLKSPSGIKSPLSPSRIPRPTSKLGYLLFMGIGLSPFFIINGLWSEIPIFTQVAPEAQAVGSLVGTSFQAANIIPVFYLLIVSFIEIRDVVSASVLITIGAADCVFLMFFWSWSVSNRSWGLIVGAFVSGIVGCTMMLVIWSFTSRYRTIYTSALSGGLGLSGLIPSLVSIAQNAGSHPAFSPQWYFCFCLVVMCMSLCCLLCVVNTTKGQALLRRVPTSVKVDGTLSINQSLQASSLPPSSSAIFRSALAPILHQLWTSLVVYFALPGLPPYVFGQDSLRFAYLTFMIANTSGRMLAGKFVTKRFSILNTLQTIILCYFISVACKVEFMYHPSFSLLIAMFIFAAVNGYTTTLCYVDAADCVGQEHAPRVCRWVAIAEQTGSLGGQLMCTAAIAFGIFDQQ